MSFVSSKGNILCRLVKIELYKIFAIINRAIKGLHCICNVTLVTSCLCAHLSVISTFISLVAVQLILEV